MYYVNFVMACKLIINTLFKNTLQILFLYRMAAIDATRHPPQSVCSALTNRICVLPLLTVQNMCNALFLVS
jgi:hypothetical protein